MAPSRFGTIRARSPVSLPCVCRHSMVSACFTHNVYQMPHNTMPCHLATMHYYVVSSKWFHGLLAHALPPTLIETVSGSTLCLSLLCLWLLADQSKNHLYALPMLMPCLPAWQVGLRSCMCTNNLLICVRAYTKHKQAAVNDRAGHTRTVTGLFTYAQYIISGSTDCTIKVGLITQSLFLLYC